MFSKKKGDLFLKRKMTFFENKKKLTFFKNRKKKSKFFQK